MNWMAFFFTLGFFAFFYGIVHAVMWNNASYDRRPHKYAKITAIISLIIAGLSISLGFGLVG